jgi:hypothetical protein
VVDLDMADNTEYIEALKRRLEQLKDEIGNDRYEVRQLLEIIKGKEEQVDHIAKLLAAEGVSLDGGELDGATPISVSDMAYEVLAQQVEPEPIHYRELAQLITAEGKLIPGQDPAANLVSHLSRDERFMRVARGTYALAEWGLEPAKKTSTRQHTRKKRR